MDFNSLKMNSLVTSQLDSGIILGQGTLKRKMKVKRKLSPNGSQGWKQPADSQNSKDLSDECRLRLVSIAQATYNANIQYHSIVDEYLRWRNKLLARTTTNSRPTRFDNDDLQTMEDAIKVYPLLDQSAVWLVLKLSENAYLDIWRRAAENMAYLRNLTKHQTPKHLENGRIRAIELKNCRTTIENNFAIVEKELSASGFDHACKAIREKIAMLSTYEEAYPLPPGPRIPTEVYDEPQVTFSMSTLIFIVLVGLIISFIPMCVACLKSTNTPGSTNDPDFYLQIQSTSLQLLSLITAMYLAHQRLLNDNSAWKYACWFTVFGCICAILAIPFYLIFPTISSSFASFFANTMQIGAMLQLALIAKNPKQKQL
ncbi:hypothetical protein F5Y11DRAFT_362493 [Daldinia sp. FL1419]|nr:hypothetical protein F5Y11DRAFT_362493 [Daldinia sp. FL1419]